MFLDFRFLNIIICVINIIIFIIINIIYKIINNFLKKYYEYWKIILDLIWKLKLEIIIIIVIIIINKFKKILIWTDK
jgi:hypothetical protein